METEKKFAILQNTYAAALAETVNTYGKLNVLDEIVKSKKIRQKQTAPYLNQQLGIDSADEVFTKLAEIFGCANWTVEQTDSELVATATACKLCAMSKKMGGTNPCHGWCLDPMFAMIEAIGIEEKNITVESTLMDGDCCKVVVKKA